MTTPDDDNIVWCLPGGSRIDIWQQTPEGTWAAQWISASEDSASWIEGRAVSREAVEATAEEWLRQNGLHRSPLPSPVKRGEPSMVTALMTPVTITTTFFPDRAARSKREEKLTPKELVRCISETAAPEKAKLPWFKLAIYGSLRTGKNSLRHDANVLAVSGAEGDYDGGKVSFEQAVEIAKAAGLWCIIYTSPSHTRAAPRWRVLVLFSRDLPPAERYRLVSLLNGIYGGILAPESFTLSQAYYFGRVVGAEEYRVELIEGTPIDLLDGLTEIGRPNGSIGNGSAPEGSIQLKPDDNGVVNFADRFPDVFNETRIAAQITSGAAYHLPCTQLLGWWAIHGVDQDDAQRRLECYFEQVAEDRRDQRWHDRYRDIPRCVSDIYRKESEKADAIAADIAANGATPTSNGEDFSAADALDPNTCTVQAWLDRDLPEPDLLLGPFSTTTRAMFVAETGIGKTNVAMAMSFHMAAGESFMHWSNHRPARVVFIDGEMSNRLLRSRIRDAARRLGKAEARWLDRVPEDFYFLCRDDSEMMLPLNTKAGQQFIDKFVDEIGGVDFIVFDNIQSLLLGDMKDEVPWQQTLPWIRSLTRRGIGQLWIHHTGHDTTRSYGTKTREWQLDTVMIAEKVERADTDIAFSLKYSKARERTPDNRTTYDPVVITLADDEWKAEGEGAPRGKPPSPLGRKFYDALVDALAAPYANIITINGRQAVSVEQWKGECVRLGLLDPKNKPDSERALFSKHRRELITANRIACQGDRVWTLP